MATSTEMSPPSTKGFLRFSIAATVIPLVAYSIIIAQFFIPYFRPGGLNLTSEEHIFVFTVIVSNILLTVALGYLIFALIKAELASIYWHNEFRRVTEATHAVVKAKQIHCAFADTAHVLYDLYNLTQASDVKKPRLGLWVNRIKDVFNQYSSSGQSAVCIKLFDMSNRGKIKTAIRDDISKLTRSKTDRTSALSLYDAGANTAFAEIISDAISKDWFFCNDLTGLTSYGNANPHWRDFYNAAVVAPIKPTGVRVSENTVGFLCVDSKAGKFDEAIAVSTLVFFAGMLYDHLQTTAVPQTRS